MGNPAAACPAPTPVETGGFRALDALARDPLARGFHSVHGSRAVLAAAARHVARRARAVGRTLLLSSAGASCPWRDLALRCGVATADPLAAAQEILVAAGGAILLAVEGVSTAWGRAVAEEVARLLAGGSSGVLVLACTEAAPATIGAQSGDAESASILVIRGVVAEDELHLWWDALARDAERQLTTRFDRLEALEGWWSAALSAHPDHRVAAPALSAAATTLLRRIALSRRPWRPRQLGLLLETEHEPRSTGAVPAPRLSAAMEARDELLTHGLLDADARGWLVASDTEEAAGAEDTLAVAAALEQMPADTWAWARASELYATLSLADRAEKAALRAMDAVGEPAARTDFWLRWSRSIALLPPEASGARFLRAAELALRFGDVDRAFDLARSAVSRDGEDFEVLLMLGRTTTARGDLTTAAILLSKAIERAPEESARARALVEMAEAQYKASDFAGARRTAEEALAGADDLETRLLARNVLGKLLLASAAWSEAERHFAADAWEAACGGDQVGELRARLNRGVALLSGGWLPEARAMLMGVLDDGEKIGDLRATGFALTNLAVIATLRNEYMEALRLSEQAIDIWRQAGDRVPLSIGIANLADLRVRLGLVAEAEQVLAFGRKVCSPSIPGTWAPQFSLVSAQIHLAQGRTREAAAEIASAIASASGSNHGTKVGEFYALAARIALEDGDLARAQRALEGARSGPNSRGIAAEVALLEATRARLSGEPFAEAARTALDLAREAHDNERIREAYVLLHHAAALAGDTRTAREHLLTATGLRDELASALPEQMRPKLLARPALAELARLEARAAEAEQAAREEGLFGFASRSVGRDSAFAGPSNGPAGDGVPWSSRVTRPASRSEALHVPASRRIVGRAPAIVALLSQIQKVGASDTTVLIQGESGTGKELVAEGIHEASPRRSGPLVKVNCAALVETLLLSELFGHEKGAFTGAASRRRGRFELAEGGTLFLDEIGDISSRTQVALLRVLQDKTFERVGGVSPIRANVRVVCATHRDLRAMVARGEFREDLYYRLRQVVLDVPPLRRRMGDLAPIAAAILARIAAERGTVPQRLSSRAMAALSRHAWPGNVRELENALRAATLFAEAEVIDLSDITANVEGLTDLEADLASESMPPAHGSDRGADFGSDRASDPPNDGAASLSASAPRLAPVDAAYAHVRSGVSLSEMKREIERECIARALAESGGNITRAASLLGMKRPRLSQLVKQYGFGGVSEDWS